MAPKVTLKRYGYTALVAIIVGRFSRYLNCSSRLSDTAGKPKDRIWLGNYGENIAADFLRAHGCRILARNYRSPRKGEVDIVARDGCLLLFVEVKTRAEGSRIRGLDAVDRSKRALIERGANSWLRQLGTRQVPWRFDVIEVTVKEGEKPKVNHVRNAF